VVIQAATNPEDFKNIKVVGKENKKHSNPEQPEMESSSTQDSIPNTAEGSDVSNTGLGEASLPDEDEPFVSAANIVLITYDGLKGKISAGFDKKNRIWISRDKKLKRWVSLEYNHSKTSFLDEVTPYSQKRETV
jgi:hypothetical protein